MARAGFVYDDAFLGYRFGRHHPLQQVRLQMNCQLLEALGIFDSGAGELIAPMPATEADLLLVHTPAYVDALRELSAGRPIQTPGAFGFGDGDNPPFHGMYEATLLYVGATKEAVRRVVDGINVHAFNNSGGLHHALPGRAAGFCLANDCALAARWLSAAGHRVAYIDIDAHHGDGVQHIFYSDPSVLTVSLHETPETLFPRVTGYVEEIGSGAGAGYNVNVPMLAGSSDDQYRYAFDEVVHPVIAAFRPTAIVLQVGADGHFGDPLAHLALTSYGWLSVVREVISCGLPIIALGGGGYNIETVARLWTLLLAALADVELPAQVPPACAGKYRTAALHDLAPPLQSPSVRERCDRNVREVAAALRRSVFPILGIA